MKEDIQRYEIVQQPLPVVGNVGWCLNTEYHIELDAEGFIRNP